jgi:hypothetical protein
MAHQRIVWLLMLAAIKPMRNKQTMRTGQYLDCNFFQLGTLKFQVNVPVNYGSMDL